MDIKDCFSLHTDEGIEAFLRDSETGYEDKAVEIYRTYRTYGLPPIAAAVSALQDLVEIIE